MRQALARALPSTLEVAAVRFHPRDPGQVSLDVSVPAAVAGESAEAVRERALRAAVYVGRSAVVAGGTADAPPVQRLEVRIILRPGGEPVFVGGTTAAVLREADPITTPAAGLYALFASTWWAPRLVPGAAAITASASPAP
jgi:hypothetical protein